MKKTVLLVMAFILCVQQSRSQFSRAVKDSILRLLSYPSASYNISLSFKAEDYAAPDDKPALHTLSRQQLLEKKKGDYTDASLYKALAMKSWHEDKNQQEAAQYLTDAGQKYQDWINAEPANAAPVEELLDMCIQVQHYELVPGILSYAMPLFPGHLPLLRKAIFYEQYVAKDYSKSSELISQALAVDSLDLMTLSFRSGLQAARHMEAMQQRQPFAFTEIPGLKAAIDGKHSANTGLKHLYHYHQLFYIYMKVVAQALASDADPLKMFDSYTLTTQEKEQVEAAENWMRKALERKDKNEVQLLSSLAVIQCIKKDYPAAAALYDQASRITGGISELEGRILSRMFMKDYAEVEKLLQEKTAAGDSFADYGSLLMIYSKYSRNQEAELALLKKLQATTADDPVKNQLLATGFLKAGQPGLAAQYVSLLDDKSRNNILIKLVAAIVDDKRSAAAVYLNDLLHRYPDDADGLAVKKLTSL